MFVDIVSALKTEGAKRFLCVIYEFLNIAYHIAVTLPKNFATSKGVVQDVHCAA